ncbi:MAG: sodium:proton antiporter NhaD [Saprospiraceae bacterium]|nr:sodium:proton antiporter NhaD [Saprospiraceae bacterium]HPG05857.1 sodium:proton antiporter NhaD [Saprospiraceae bacterium]
MVWLFVIGYVFIALEHVIKIDKSASAVLTAVVLWTWLILFGSPLVPDMDQLGIEHALLEHLGDIGSILFFLLAAMTIVELVDVHDGFRIITKQINTLNKVKLLWIISLVTFFLSALLDNLTTTIVMATLIRKLIHEKQDLWIMGGFVIIAANAGGAWSPIGDVTTIMLWIGGQISALHVIQALIIPSLVCIIVPLLFMSFIFRGEISPAKSKAEASGEPKKKQTSELISNWETQLVFWCGIGALLFVPIFKNLTHLPPFMGMLLSLGFMWILTDLLHMGKKVERGHLSVSSVIRRVDTPSILFFLGILLAVAALETGEFLQHVAVFLEETLKNIYLINMIIGLLSAIVDNVPLVAGAMGMYSMTEFPPDHIFWSLLAYCAGTGGSVLIIGSAAGVAMMGILKIDFIWYLKRISLLALLGYLAGMGAYMIQHIWT